MIDPGAVDLARLHADEWRFLCSQHWRLPEDDHTRMLAKAAERAKSRALDVLWRAVVEMMEGA